MAGFGLLAYLALPSLGYVLLVLLPVNGFGGTVFGASVAVLALMWIFALIGAGPFGGPAMDTGVARAGLAVATTGWAAALAAWLARLRLSRPPARIAAASLGWALGIGLAVYLIVVI